jgi:catechol 2,3-dioxygenase-like lactoylglutathione lyase family enzyme
VPQIKHVGRVMVPVADQDTAIAFYTEKLGFEVRSDTPFGNGDRWVEVAPAGAATTVALVMPREGESAGVQSRVAFSTSDIDSDHAQLRERGVDCDDVMRMGDPVPPMFFFRDQDSNNLLLVQAG